jgi:general secretion pathway protein A
MYLEFYGLKEKPFNATPDPRFLYLTPGHREALSQLIYGVQEHKGFLVLTGEIGTGKTTLLQALLQKLDSNTAVAFVFNSKLAFDEVLEYALHDYGVGKAEGSRVQRLVAFNNYLIERRRAGQNTVLILDEAQNLDADTLEQVRLLSNFETPTDKLLQILLVGQPELKDKLQLPGLRQLKQRIGLRCAIPPMTVEETRDYIRTRLRIAGGRDLNLFDEAAVRRIAEYAAGIPRVINIVCDHAMLIGYADQTRRVSRAIVERAVRYLEQGELPSRQMRPVGWLRRSVPRDWALGTVLASTVGILGVAALTPVAWTDVWSSVVHSLIDLARVARQLMGG